MDPETLPPGAIGAESSLTTGTSPNAPLGQTLHQLRYQLVHRDAAIVATENMSLDAHLKTVAQTASSKNKKQRANGSESIHICVNHGQLRIYRTAGVCRELHDQCIASHNGKSAWSTKAFVRTIHEIEHHDVVSSGLFAEEFCDKSPWE